MATDARRRERRERTDPTTEQQREREPDAAPAYAGILALQRTAGNAAVARMMRPRTLARFNDGQVSSRAVGIWEEKGAPQGQTMEQQGADWNEATRQVGAMERETTRRSEALHQQRGGGTSTPEQAQQDWLKAEKSVITDFVCERTDDWTKLIARNALWTGPPGEPQTALTAIKTKLSELNTHLNEQDDLGARLTLITDAEGLIDAWIATHGSGNAAKADELLMLKMHTLAYERRRRLKMLKIQDEYGIKMNSTVGIQRHKQAFAPGGNPTPLSKVAEKTGLSLFSLEELDMLLTVFANYAPLLGKQREGKLGAQPLQNFTRFKVGLDRGNNPLTDEPKQSPGDFGVTILDTITMYDKSNRDVLDFPTKPQQFRGTIEHELSHALLEPLIAKGGGDTMIQKFAKDMPFWGGSITVKSGAVGAEVPPTNYGRNTAQEDLAECMMFFFEDPKDLQTRCPERFTWIKDNLGSVLGPEHMKKINEGKF